MHMTSALDHVVPRGRVTLLLDQAEVALSPCDLVVQRGTNHHRLNPGPALLMGVLLDAPGRSRTVEHLRARGENGHVAKL
jgi:hypothetical protein